MNWKTKETQEAHRRGCKNGGSVKVAKGFAYMKLHNPERFLEISTKAGKMPKKRRTAKCKLS